MSLGLAAIDAPFVILISNSSPAETPTVSTRFVPNDDVEANATANRVSTDATLNVYVIVPPFPAGTL